MYIQNLHVDSKPFYVIGHKLKLLGYTNINASFDSKWDYSLKIIA